MKARGAAIALAILLGGVGTPAHHAEARAPEARQSKPAARSVAATPPNRTAARAATNATARGANQRQAVAARHGATTRQAANRRGGGRSYAAAGSGYGGGVSCVPYARQATGMAISGNGGQWWYNAAGLYARSNRPEVGSIMAFPGSGGMRAGHVAVVERVISNREILIHHANWGGPGIRRGSIMRGVSVVDASPNNDWSQVRVQVGYSNENYGRTYAVQGFIHNRPDASGGMMLAGTGLRGGVSEASARGYEEVAQAPATGRGSRR